MKKISEIKIGDVFGELTVLEELGKIRPEASNHWYYKCRCTCGNETIIRGTLLRNGKNKKCRKCSAIENLGSKLRYKHGMSNTRLFNIWQGMKERCYTKSCTTYKNYGGRGIKICDEWRNDFVVFYNWSMSNGYQHNLSIDRIDVNGNYEPSNCRWADKFTQANNKRNNHYIEYNGETHSVSEWERILGFNKDVILQRITKYGWTIEKALTTPIEK